MRSPPSHAAQAHDERDASQKRWEAMSTKELLALLRRAQLMDVRLSVAVARRALYQTQCESASEGADEALQMSYLDFRECLLRCAHARANGRRAPMLVAIPTSPVTPLPKALDQFLARLFAAEK
jgi:hypothetical protein